MLRERVDRAALKRPRCVGCAQPMRLMRKTLRFGGLPDVYTFECEACGEWHIEEVITAEVEDE